MREEVLWGMVVAGIEGETGESMKAAQRESHPPSHSEEPRYYIVRRRGRR